MKRIEHMQDTIFRVYDIRGKIGSELVIEQTYDLVKAIAYYFCSKNPYVKTIAVGMDGRTHGPALKAEVCQALQDSGLEVVFIGVCPSPLLYFVLNTMPVDAGIMITASHNPKEYNGFKLCLGTSSLWGQEIQVIKKLYHEKKAICASLPGSYREHALIPTYVDYMASLFPDLVNMNLSVVIDCGNGATGTVMPLLIQKMCWRNVSLLYPEVDGTYPHHEADPVVEKNMQEVKKVLETTQAQVGIGFDGDGDRMAPMTKEGCLVAGDQVLALLSKDYVQQNPGSAIVCDIKSSASLLEAIKSWGGAAYLSPSGYSSIKKNMQEHNALIGGELSGHFFFHDRYFGYDDGIYAAFRLLEMLTQSGKSLSQLVDQLPHKVSSPEFRIACDEDKKWHVVEGVKQELARRSDATMITIDGIRVTLAHGLGVLRASNTQPALSLRFEANSKHELREVKEIFVQAMEHYLDGVALRKQIDTLF
jgi:phosphomannomutase / phosphoglucomutase